MCRCGLKKYFKYLLTSPRNTSTLPPVLERFRAHLNLFFECPFNFGSDEYSRFRKSPKTYVVLFLKIPRAWRSSPECQARFFSRFPGLISGDFLLPQRTQKDAKYLAGFAGRRLFPGAASKHRTVFWVSCVFCDVDFRRAKTHSHIWPLRRRGRQIGRAHV